MRHNHAHIGTDSEARLVEPAALDAKLRDGCKHGSRGARAGLDVGAAHFQATAFHVRFSGFGLKRVKGV